MESKKKQSDTLSSPAPLSPLLPCCATLCPATLRHAKPNRGMLRHATPYYAPMRCAMPPTPPHYATPGHSNPPHATRCYSTPRYARPSYFRPLYAITSHFTRLRNFTRLADNFTPCFPPLSFMFLHFIPSYSTLRNSTPNYVTLRHVMPRSTPPRPARLRYTTISLTIASGGTRDSRLC